MKVILTKLKLSARAYHRLLKVLRSIADFRSEQKVSLESLKEAFSYKQMIIGPR